MELWPSDEGCGQTLGIQQSGRQRADWITWLSTFPLIFCQPSLLAKSCWKPEDTGSAWCGSNRLPALAKSRAEWKTSGAWALEHVTWLHPWEILGYSLLVGVILQINRIKTSATQILVSGMSNAVLACREIFIWTQTNSQVTAVVPVVLQFRNKVTFSFADIFLLYMICHYFMYQYLWKLVI